MNVKSPNAQTHSVGFLNKVVTIQQIALDPSTGATTAICVDKTGYEVRVPAYTMRAKGIAPEVGEMWLVDQQLGFWSFAAYVGPSDALTALPVLPVIPPSLHAGTAVLVAGAATVLTTEVTAVSVIQLTVQATNGTRGFLAVGARTAGVSFGITSSSGLDTSTVGWTLTEPG